MNHVFISYSSKEAEIARKVCTYLEGHHIPCWMAPRNVKPGDNYATQIVNAIRKCDALVLLASEGTNQSGHVSNEVSLAFDNRKTIIPFKLQDIQFTDEFLYFLGRKHWIEAHRDFNEGLVTLLDTLHNILKSEEITEMGKGTAEVPKETIEIPKDTVEIIRKTANVTEEKQMAVTLPRAEIVRIVKENARKYSYNLEKYLSNEEEYQSFKELALRLFSETVHTCQHHRQLPKDTDIIELITKELSEKTNMNIQVRGLPGSAKNMILQLVFYKMLENFETGNSDCLPFYFSASYYEKIPYNPQDVRGQMKGIIEKEFRQYFAFLNQHTEVKPVLLIEAIREHVVSKVFPEAVLLEVLSPLGDFNRITTIDVGLVKNRSRLKRVIPIAGETQEYVLFTTPVSMEDKPAVLSITDCVLKMYRYELEAEDVYQVLKSLQYPTVDIFMVRLVARELLSSYQSDINLTEMYEKMALIETGGDEEKLKSISKVLFQYVFDEAGNMEEREFNAAEWSLPHKHNTYLEFLIVYHIVNQIKERSTDCSFFRIMLTAAANHFMASFLKEDFSLQETLLHFIVENYEEFDVQQKSNGAYWLGKITYKNLANSAVEFLRMEYDAVKPLVEGRNQMNQENLDYQFLFRSICMGLLLQGQVKTADEYGTILIMNDVANAVNRGATIEYYGDGCQIVPPDGYNLDVELSTGEQALKILTLRMDNHMQEKEGVLFENNLVTLLTLLQARIQNKFVRLTFDISPYVSKALEYLQIYLMRPQNIKSVQLLYYYETVAEDFENYLSTENFAIGPMIYNRLSMLRKIKRSQWVESKVKQPESVVEHSYSAWLMAALFLPEELDAEGYSKKVVLDMLLIHDMAEAVLGDQTMQLNEPKKDLKEQNEIMRKLFLKGSYPNVANLSYFYKVWAEYYEEVSMNAKIARDINLLQTVYTFCEYYRTEPDCFSDKEAEAWLMEKKNLITEVGYELFERLIENNMDFKAIVSE